ncbi:MAG: hypothetical protein ACRC68_00855 [Clostridium sp.]
MFDVFINGISMRSLGLKIEKRPPIPTTKTKYKTTDRESNNGNVYDKIGIDDNVIPIQFVLVERNSLADVGRIALKLLREAETLVYSSEPDLMYYIKQVKSDDIAVALRSIGRFNTEFTVAPGAYLKEGKNKIVVTQNTTIENKYDESEPVITIFGQGNIDLVIAQQVIKLKNIDGSITLDTTILEAYKGSELANSKVNGEFPLLPPGVFSVTWSGNVSRIEIVPNWRCN